ncbi:uncharacterized protein LOC128381153 [Scomber scombrus]|uniref:Uncharacterized protein LOC128381153 n=1 Tax=Scomber scombrus TaxID=13677 RepID=A0AAV1NXH7_SCOSC
MSGGKHLLLLAVFLHLARCQGQLQVSVTPPLKYIFVGDLLYLHCSVSSGTPVKWYKKDVEEKQTNNTWKIAVATPAHSGSYHCESNGQKSNNFLINVLNYEPRGSLTVKTGHPVMQTGNSVVLQLDHDDGLQGWLCWVSRGQTVKKIKLKLKDGDKSIAFQPNRLEVPETIFWCTDKEQNDRTNQQVIRTTGKAISLEMYPHPAITGESLTMKCLVWGTDRIKQVTFYDERGVIGNKTSSPLDLIEPATLSTEGKYKCDATFTYVANTGGPENHVVSDMQDVFVHEPPIRAVLEGDSCSCPDCTDDLTMSYRFYKKNGQTWARMESLKEGGSYACRAVMKYMRTAHSEPSFKNEDSSMSGIVIVILIVIGMAMALIGVVLWFHNKRRLRRIDGAIYEDVQMKQRGEGDAQYEELKLAGAKEGEYDTLNAETQGGKKKEGEYDVLNKEQMKEGVYNTLGAEGPSGGGEGGYEALKKDGKQEGVYNTLGAEGAAGGGEGGYEALKKAGKQEGVYHTLGKEGAAGGGEYEALKKEGVKGDDYQTIEVGGDAEGEG